MTGQITNITGRGFGFIQRSDSSDKIFFHAHDLVGVRFEDLWVGHSVEFEVGSDREGRARAQKVRVVE